MAPSDDIPWEDLRLVLAVARAGALGPAARGLGLNASTVFRRLGAVEARLGQSLFERHRSGYTPTPAGAEITALAGRMDEEVRALSRRFAGRAPGVAGSVRITTVDTLLVHLLTPALARLRRVEPGLALDLVVGNETLNLARREADIALRASFGPPAETLVGRRVATIGWAVYGPASPDRPVSPDAPDAPENPASPDAAADWVALSGDPPNPVAGRMTARFGGTDKVVYRQNTVLGLAEAIEAGIGIGPLPCFIGDGRPALRRLTEPDGADAMTLWLLTHPDLKASPRVRAVLDHLAGEFGAWRARLEGRPV